MSFETTLLRYAVIAMLFSPAIPAQTSPQAPAFEVAVIKPALPIAQAMPLLAQGKLRAGISIDKARVDMQFVTLTDLIVAAYKLKAHQISGPDWLLMQRFNIEAKLPDSAAESEVPAMLRTLLAERFGMKAHTELRNLSAYSLVIGKSGAKLERSTLPPDPEPSNGLTTLSPSADGTISASAGPAGPVQLTMGPDGVKMVLLKTTISAFADVVTSMVGKPVVDRTGLAGSYRIVLDIARQDMQNLARALGMGGPAAAPGTPADPGGGSMFLAVEQLGLKLDSRKEQIETLVIDQIEKLPTAN
jgi:uncharacterized protein (TIGR03435 family)